MIHDVKPCDRQVRASVVCGARGLVLHSHRVSLSGSPVLDKWQGRASRPSSFHAEYVCVCMQPQVPPPPQTGRYNPLTHSWLKEPVEKKYVDADVKYKHCRVQVSPGYLGSYNVITNQWYDLLSPRLSGRWYTPRN